MFGGIDIIIINYYSLKKIKVLLNSIYKSRYHNIRLNIIIISNSAETGFDELPFVEKVVLKINDKNYGYGYACNEAMQFCEYNYLLILNPDTILFKDTLLNSYKFMEENKNIMVMGVQHLNLNNKVAFSCSRFPKLKNHLNDIFGLSKINPRIFKSGSLMEDWDHLESRFVDQVMGAYMMIRRSCIDQYGFMDERFFVFGEDMDFCKKVWLNGGKVYYNATINITHEGSNSTQGVNSKKLCYSLEGKLKFAHKYFSKANYVILAFSVILIEPFTRLFFSLITGKLNTVKIIFEGYYLFYKRREFK